MSNTNNVMNSSLPSFKDIFAPEASIIWVILVIVLIVLIIWICFVLTLAETVMFCPSHDVNRYPKNIEDYEDIYISTLDAHKIYNKHEIRYEPCINAWYFPNFTSKDRLGHCETTILYFHGNSGNITHRHYVIDICRNFNLNLLLVDYRGYGKSDGVPTPDGIYQDGETAYHYLAGRVDRDTIVVWGESLGGTVACHVASKYKCRALILLATFSCLEDVIKSSVDPPILAKLMAMTVNTFFHPMYSKGYLKHIKCPVAIMHSKTDSLIPYRSSHILFNSIPHHRKVLYTINGDHASPKITNETLKKLFAFVGVQTECLDHYLDEVNETLTKIVSDNPGLMPSNTGFFGINI